jgi:hypothetical protein
VLVAKRRLFGNDVPTIAGGGTVDYVSPWGTQYTPEIEHREDGVSAMQCNAMQACPPPTNGTERNGMEWNGAAHAHGDRGAAPSGGTPGILQAIRCGIAFKVKDAVGPTFVHSLEKRFSKLAVEVCRAPRMGDAPVPALTPGLTALQQWVKHPNIMLMGADRPAYWDEDRLTITAFNVAATHPANPTVKSRCFSPGGAGQGCACCSQDNPPPPLPSRSRSHQRSIRTS